MTTREEWLHKAIKEMRPWFEEKGFPLPKKMGISCGFVKGRGDKGIGQCWDPSHTSDETTHMFICPTQDNPLRVLDILLHELIHAAVGCKEKHRGNFRKLALEFGLAGKMTATYAEIGSPLYKELYKIAEKLGKYPHSGIILKGKGGGDGDGDEKKGNGWIRLKSINEDKYKIMIAGKQYEEHGAPKDPWGDELIPNDADSDEARERRDADKEDEE